jgi:hypothetical protein
VGNPVTYAICKLISFILETTKDTSLVVLLVGACEETSTYGLRQTMLRELSAYSSRWVDGIGGFVLGEIAGDAMG